MAESQKKKYDIICVGGGVMSGTLALMTKLLNSDTKIGIFERLDKTGLESSEAWNNAGTGHSGYCELNYTPEQEDGTIDISKAVNILSQFEQSKEFWSHLVKNGYISDPGEFITSIPHHSWVRGEKDVEFLKKRYKALTETPMFKTMKFSEDKETLKKWFPLIMADRDASETMAATRMGLGTGVDFGRLTEIYFQILKDRFDTPLKTGHEVIDLNQKDDKSWVVTVKNLEDNTKQNLEAKHVFVGAGGRALSLLQKTNIKEKDGYGGFPVSGQFLICKNPDVIEKHWAKVYSKAGPDAPPMSTPHLDSRYIDGKKELLYGPFAGFSPKFLKMGSNWDLFKSVRWKNIRSLLGAFWHNLDLTSYLIGQLMMNHDKRMDDLRKFIKDAKNEDWRLDVAGQRVQIIKPDPKQGGKVQFGTEVIHSKDGSISTLLGASPGASTAVHIMLEVLQYIYPKNMKSSEWKEKLDEIIPFWEEKVDQDEEKFKKVQANCSKLLQLDVEH